MRIPSIANVTDAFSQFFQKAKRHRKIHKLSIKLWSLGFHERALSELNTILMTSGSSRVRKLAAREILHFMMCRPEQAEATLVDRCFESLKAPVWDRAASRQIAIMRAEYLQCSGRQLEAQQVLQAQLKRQDHVDLHFALSNLQADENEKAQILGGSSALSGLRLQFHPKAGDQAIFDRICVEAGYLPRFDNDALISILLPTYNNSTRVLTALNSIAAQTLVNFECLIVDQGSSDDTVAVVKRWLQRDHRFKLIEHSGNCGEFIARNSALNVAKGQFITCHGPEDWSHPLKLERQMMTLLRNPRKVASLCSKIHASDDLIVKRRGLFGAFADKDLTSLMFRKSVFDQIGYWDSVEHGADLGYLARIKSEFGAGSIRELSDVLSIHRDNAQAGFERVGFLAGADQFYLERQASFLKSTKSRYFAFPMPARPFAVPASMAIARERCRQPKHYDVVIASDFRLKGGSTLSSVEEIKAQYKAGIKTGIMQMCRYDFGTSSAMNEQILALLDSGQAELITKEDIVSCDLLMVRYPPVLQERQANLPQIDAKVIKVAINQPPMSDYSASGIMRYEIPRCVENLRHAFGKDAKWHAIGPSITEAIAKHHSEWIGAADYAEEDWHNIVDLRNWRRSLDHRVSARPIIGRHSRDHKMKWPADRETLLSIYPNTPEFEVRVLGGAKSPQKVLGALPSNWTVHEFGSITPADFLKDLDVFVYFTNDNWVEAFGRVIIEAMSVGVPVILPHSYEPLFHHAALYTTPDNVQSLVRKLAQDPSFYRAQVEAAFHYVDEKFGYHMHIKRVQAQLSRDCLSQ